MAPSDLYESVPDRQPDRVATRRGFVDGDEMPIAVVAEHTEGGETRLDLTVDADYVAEEDKHQMTAYLDPLMAIEVGERLTAAGRAALAELVEAVK